MTTTNYVFEAATPLIWVVIACIGALVRSRRVHTRAERLETWVRWWGVTALGVGSLWMTVSFLAIPDTMTTAIGFTRTPFVFEIAFANLGLAFMGFRTPSASTRERLTIGISSGLFLWGATIGHFYQAFANGDHAPGNVGGVLVTDVFVPLILIVLARLSQSARTASTGQLVNAGSTV